MKKILIIGSIMIAVCGALPFFGCGGGKGKAQPTAGDQANPDLGEQLYMGKIKPEINCAKCHEEGEGPNLSERINSLSDSEILTVMVQGKLKMPAYGSLLAEKERKAILGCLRARFHEENPD